MMTALGSRSACTVRRGGSARQLHAEQQTAVPAEHQNQIEILGGGCHGHNQSLKNFIYFFELCQLDCNSTIFPCQHKTKVQLKQRDNTEADWKQMRGAFLEHHSGA